VAAERGSSGWRADARTDPRGRSVAGSASLGVDRSRARTPFLNVIGGVVDLDKLARFLEDKAKRKRTVYYSELVTQFGLPPLDGAWIGHPLERAFDKLDREDAGAHRPFRTSLVVSKEKNMPGDGYFKSLSELKGIHAKSEKQRLEAFLQELSAAMNYKW